MRSPRRRAREFALQGLYQWLLGGESASGILRNLSELEGYGAAEEAFLKAELAGVIGAAADLRARIEPLVGRKWSEVSPVEKAILLIGTWELASMPAIPYRVAINEAIELAKRYGGTDGHKYVNGILDRVAAELRPEEIASGATAERRPRKQAGAPVRASSPRKAEA